MNEKEQRDAIEAVLNECISMGLVEIQGITDDGEWLYGVTEAGKELVLMDDVASAISSIIEDSEEE